MRKFMRQSYTMAELAAELETWDPVQSLIVAKWEHIWRGSVAESGWSFTGWLARDRYAVRIPGPELVAVPAEEREVFLMRQYIQQNHPLRAASRWEYSLELVSHTGSPDLKYRDWKTYRTMAESLDDAAGLAVHYLVDTRGVEVTLTERQGSRIIKTVGPGGERSHVKIQPVSGFQLDSGWKRKSKRR